MVNPLALAHQFHSRHMDGFLIQYYTYPYFYGFRAFYSPALISVQGLVHVDGVPPRHQTVEGLGFQHVDDGVDDVARHLVDAVVPFQSALQLLA